MTANAKRISAVVFLIICAFYPSLFAELCSIDDLDTYNWVVRSADPSLKDLFFPHATGAYYRPLIAVSYLFDKYIWLFDTRLMHLDNLLFHLANALLVYYLAFLLLPRAERQNSTVPLVASLLFGIHPLTTESVAWISGRTDIMAGTFVLLSAVFLLRFNERRKVSNLVFAVFALLPGLLIKETPLAFVLGALFILSVKTEDPLESHVVMHRAASDIVCCAFFAGVAEVLLLVTYSVWPVFVCAMVYLVYELYRDRKGGEVIRQRTFFVLAGGTLLPIGLFFLIRKVVFTSSVSSIGRTMKLIVTDLNYAFQTFFGAVGFYVRKFFFPFPLNFAIREIDPLYNTAGVAVFFLCLYAIRRRSMNSALFLAGICLLLPALPLSLGTVTWTAYAERYVYMSTSFWALAVALCCGRYVMAHGYGRYASGCVALLLLLMGVCTLQRNIVWRTNVGLLGDTVKKSPAFKLIIPDYMVALMRKGDLQGAKAQYFRAQSIPSVGYMESLDINMAAIYLAEGKNDEAVKLYERALFKTSGKSVVAYGAYINYLQGSFAAALKSYDGSESTIGITLLESMEKLYQLNKDPQLLYRAGQLALAMGKCEDALRIFTSAGKNSPAQGDYSRISLRLAAQLAAGYCRQDKL